jgi:hypothetical protein
MTGTSSGIHLLILEEVAPPPGPQAPSELLVLRTEVDRKQRIIDRVAQRLQGLTRENGRLWSENQQLREELAEFQKRL